MNIDAQFLKLFKENVSLDYIKEFYSFYEKDININSTTLAYDTPFTLAAQHNQVKVLKWLAENGANINHQNKNLGFNALMMAILVDNQEIIDFLLKEKINLYSLSKLGANCMDIALSEGSVATVKKLLHIGLTIDNENEKTLNLAIDNYFFSKSIDMIKFLIEEKCFINYDKLKSNLPDKYYEEIICYKQIIDEKKTIEHTLTQNQALQNIKKIKV